MYNSYFGATPVSNSGCKCNDRNAPPPVQVFDERPCFEPRKEADSIQYQLTNGQNLVVVNGGAIKFNALVEKIGHGITYNEASGTYTLRKNGIYEISWEVSVLTTDATFIDLTLYRDGSPYVISSSPLITDEVSGSAILKVGDCDTTIYLANTSGESITLAATTVQANIVITAN